MLKIAHIRKTNDSEAVKALAEIFQAKDLRRQERVVEQMKKLKIQSHKKAGSATN